MLTSDEEMGAYAFSSFLAQIARSLFQVEKCARYFLRYGRGEVF